MLLYPYPTVNGFERMLSMTKKTEKGITGQDLKQVGLEEGGNKQEEEKIVLTPPYSKCPTSI